MNWEDVPIWRRSQPPADLDKPLVKSRRGITVRRPGVPPFIKAAAASGNTSLAGDLDELAGLEAAHGRDALVSALERAIHFGRFRAHDVRLILAAGTGVARPTRPGDALIVNLPTVATRPLSAYTIGDQT